MELYRIELKNENKKTVIGRSIWAEDLGQAVSYFLEVCNYFKINTENLDLNWYTY